MLGRMLAICVMEQLMLMSLGLPPVWAGLILMVSITLGVILMRFQMSAGFNLLHLPDPPDPPAAAFPSLRRAA